MSVDKLIRLANLRARTTAPELHTWLGNSYPYWRDLLAGKKSFGEKITRQIEEEMGWARLSLVEPDCKAEAVVVLDEHEQGERPAVPP